MLGYVTEKTALACGMTHHGSYYGIPLWMNLDGPELSLQAKWMPLDYLIPVFSWFENIIRPIIFPDDDPVFQLKVGRDIRED